MKGILFCVFSICSIYASLPCARGHPLRLPEELLEFSADYWGLHDFLVPGHLFPLTATKWCLRGRNRSFLWSNLAPSRFWYFVITSTVLNLKGFSRATENHWFVQLQHLLEFMVFLHHQSEICLEKWSWWWEGRGGSRNHCQTVLQVRVEYFKQNGTPAFIKSPVNQAVSTFFPFSPSFCVQLSGITE